MIDFDVGVVLPAAGTGERLGGQAPKQFFKILVMLSAPKAIAAKEEDKPLFLYALEAFERMPFVKRVALVVCDRDHVQALLQETKCHKVLVVQGENTRHRSIRAGMLALTKEESNLRVIVVHDAVRPVVPIELVEQVVQAADEAGAAGVVCPLVSTVLSVGEDEQLEEALDRRTHVASETPQAFQTDVLKAAYSMCSEEELDHGTECLQLALTHGGVRARLVQGRPDELWKVTLKRDLHVATRYLQEQRNSTCIMAPEASSTAYSLVEALQMLGHKVQFLATGIEPPPSFTNAFNNVIFFHVHHTDMETPLLDFATLLDLDKQGLILHVLDHTSADGLQNMSVYDLQLAGRRMAQTYRKLQKGVVVLHCIANPPGGDCIALQRIVSTLLCADPLAFSGQTLFV